MSKPRVMIATPTPGTVKTGYMKCTMAVMFDLFKRGIISDVTDFESEEGSDLPAQRNILASKFLQRPEFTHLLSIDSDMMFQADTPARMLAADRDFVTVPASRKNFNLEKLRHAIEDGADFKDAILLATDWVSYPKTNGNRLDVINGMVEFATAGMALTLVRRNVFETMVAKGAAKPQIGAKFQDRGIINFFGVYADAAVEGQHVPEDHSFAYRWTNKCGGTIQALIDTPIFHVGDYGFGGSYFEFIQAMGRAQERRGASGFQPR